MALTMKQEKFCIEYAKCGNATEAYKRAGYKAGTPGSARTQASQLLCKSNIKERLKELSEEVKNDSIASIQEIQEFWTKVLRNEEFEEVVGATQGGPYKLSKKPEIKDRIKAAELLGKVNGLFIDKVELSGGTPIVISGEEKLED